MFNQEYDLNLSDEHFRKISHLAYQLTGIRLHDKKDLVKSRLMKRIRALGLRGFSEYMEYLESDLLQRELPIMLDVLTTNKTNFFREPKHFEFLRQRVIPEMEKLKRMRIWSAGCSSGEEPFSIAITLIEGISDISRWDIKILATDISLRMLAIAREATYELLKLENIPHEIISKYFSRSKGESGICYKVKDEIRSMVRFARLNLMESWPMKGPFDVIFCRNVMIYFDDPTRERLVNRFWRLLRPGGYLFVGHSESLTSLEHPFQYVQPAVYRKI
ncbi:TPA: methyltransferase domain-containing protein [Candidatus Poribacteria bacterium]|nr:methyltransferase domain-containing protein [Candidatus Poribacteria bacterium]HEX30386.1 methyltransferase domain-containing protein [Candidatus Poribacteria bacterium]